MQAPSVNSWAGFWGCSRLTPAQHRLRRDCCCHGQDSSRSSLLVVLYWDHSVAGLFFLLVWLFLTLSVEMEEMPRAEENCFAVIQISRCTTGVWCWPGLWSWDLSWSFSPSANPVQVKSLLLFRVVFLLSRFVISSLSLSTAFTKRFHFISGKGIVFRMRLNPVALTVKKCTAEENET